MKNLYYNGYLSGGTLTLQLKLDVERRSLPQLREAQRHLLEGAQVLQHERDRIFVLALRGLVLLDQHLKVLLQLLNRRRRNLSQQSLLYQ